MVNQHTIEHSVFDIAFGSERDAFEQEAGLGSLVKGRLLRVVDEVFDEMSNPDSVFRIDTLEIDLGTIPYEGFQEEMEDRLREKLRDLLRQKMMTLATTPHSSSEGIVTMGRLEIEQLEHFLSTGRMPWNANLRNGRTIDQMLRTAVDEDRARLVEYLRRSPRRGMIIQRLVSQFSHDVLTDFARTLAPSQASVITSVVSDFQSVWEGRGLAQSTQREFATLFWTVLLNELLNSNASPLSSRYLVRRILRRIARHRDANDLLLTTVLASEPSQGGTTAELIRELSRALNALQETEAFDDTSVGNGNGNVEGDTTNTEQPVSVGIEILRERIARALISGDVGEISPIWRTTILREHSNLLDEALRLYGRQARTRRTIADEFPEPMLRDIVALIEPNASDFIDEVVERPELFHHAIGQPTKTVGSVKRRLWEFTLTYLLVERGSRFNRRAYMGSLVRQMAAHENIRFDDLLDSLTEVLERMEVASALKRELLQILDELRGSPSVPQASDEAGSQRLIASYDLYENLKTRLTRGTSAPDGDAVDVTKLIDDLAEKYPDRLQTLLLEMRSGGISLDRAVSSLSADELAQLIRAFLSLNQRTGGGSASELLHAIESYAKQAVDLRRYNGEILERIVHDQLIDFETIIEGNTPLTGLEAISEVDGLEDQSVLADEASQHVATNGATETPDESQEAVGDAGQTRAAYTTSSDGDNEISGKQSIQSYDLYERLKEWLISGTPAVGDNALDVTKLVDELAEKHPEQLQTLLLEMRSGDVPLDRAVSSLSADEIAHLVRTFLSLSQRTGEAGTSELLQAIELYARQARDLRSYYIEILECIVNDQLIDLEAIIEGNAPSRELRTQGESDARKGVDGLIEESRTNEAIQHTSASHDAIEDSSRPTGADEPHGRESIQSYGLYERLRARLVHASSWRDTDAADSITKLIDELAEKYPEQLQTLLNEMRSGEIALERVVTSLTADETFHLIRAFLALAQRGGESDTFALVSAIELYARQARDLQRYYSEILQRIVKDQLIDFEVIIERVSSLPASDLQDEIQRDESFSQDVEGLTPQQTQQDATDRLIKYLKSGGEITNHDAVRLAHTVEIMLARHPARLRYLLESLVDSEAFSERITNLLPERLLTRVLFIMRPAGHHRMQRYADILANASYASGLDLRQGRIRRLKWRFIFQYAVIDSERFDEREFVRQYANFLAEELRESDTSAVRAILARQVELNSLPSTRELHSSISSALTQADEGRPFADGEPTRKSASRQSSRRREPEEDEDRIVEEIYVYNAGVVIASPYMPRLFDMLGLTNGPAFKDRSAAERAVHLLQFMVNERVDSPEYELVLNKILCGVRTGTPIEREIDIDDNEKFIIESLINGMIQNWKTIGNTSVTGFRESFLQREGRLQLVNGAWNLIVAPKAFDMLLDQIPWSFSTIKHPWMERVIHVEWR